MSLGAVSDQVHGPGKDTEKSYITMQAAAARTKGDVVRVGSSAVGLLDVTLADDTNVYRVAVADMDIASGARGRYQVTGRCTLTSPSLSVAAGDGLLLLDGVVADAGTTAQKPNGAEANTHFAVCLTASTSGTTQDVFLYGDAVTATT
jgi:hypothetical protein